MANNYLKLIVFLIGALVLEPNKGFTQAKVQAIGTIDGISVSREEVQREMKKHRAMVYNSITNKNAVQPINILRTSAVDSLVLIKVQEKLLTERKLWPYQNYQEFLKDLKDNNDSRKKSIADKQVLYGPVEFSEQTFFDYRFNNALIRLKQKLVEEKVITISDEDMQNQFKKMQKTVYAEEKYTLQAFTRQVRDAYIEEAYTALIKKYAKNAKQNLDAAKLNQITLTN